MVCSKYVLLSFIPPGPQLDDIRLCSGGELGDLRMAPAWRAQPPGNQRRESFKFAYSDSLVGADEENVKHTPFLSFFTVSSHPQC